MWLINWGPIVLLVAVLVAESKATRINGRHSALFSATLIVIATQSFLYEKWFWAIIQVWFAIYGLGIAIHQYYICGDSSCPSHRDGRREEII